MSFFTQAAPKVRQEGFAPSSNSPHNSQPAAPPSPPVSAFDTANMFFAHHIFPTPNGNGDHHAQPSFKQPSSLDFGDELAAMMAHQDARTNSPHGQQQQQHNGHHHPPPHNPFDTNSTAPYRQQPPHNIFDVSSPATTNHHPAHFPAHFSLPAHHSGGRLDFEPRPDFGSPGAFSPGGVPDSYRGDSSFPDRRASSRSRSRSKPPASGPGPAPRGRVSKKRSSISSPSPIPGRASAVSPTRPQAILIPPNGHHNGMHPVSPLSLHMHSQTAPSAWFAAADSPFSLPTPDSVGPGAFGSVPTAGGLGTSPKSVVSGSAKESPPPTTQDAASKQAQLASEKRRRRRESHNAVERRRRDNINEKISELATLIPECMLDPSGGTNGGDASLDGFAGAAHPSEDGDDRKDASGAVKANKGMILRKSVEYIRYLQQLVNAQATRNRELEAQLMHSGPSQPNSQSDSASPNPHAHAQEGMGGLVLAENRGNLSEDGMGVGMQGLGMSMDDDGMSMSMSMGGMGMDQSPREEDEDQELEDHDHEDLDHDPDSEPRGRVTRGRPLGVPVRVKREEEGEEGKEMEE